MATLPELTLQRLRRLRELQEQKRAIDTGDVLKKPWREVARPEQLEPPGDWFVWLLLGGRGVGKTRSAAEFILEKARRFPGARVALVGKTIGDARDTMVEGDSGILNCVSASELRGGSIDTAWNRSLGEIYFRNGTYAKTFSSEKPWRLRGPQFNFGWADESCFWADAHKGTNADTTWSNLTIATRLPASPGWPDDYRIQIVVATTPRPVALLRVTDLKLMAPGLMQRENVVITRGRTVDNLANLSDTYRVNVVAPLLGTALGRQELDAEILESRDGALWRREWFDANRMDPVPLPEMVRVVIGVDPAVTSEADSDLTGIIVAGADRRGHGYVIADYTMRGTPMEVMKKVAWAFHEHQGDRVVAEINNGGDYIGTTLKAVDPGIPYRTVHASRGKATRAEPISALYEQNRVHHLGSFPELEDEMSTWAPIDPESPDRMDACVWAFSDLKSLLSGSWKDAYGIVTCAACQKPYLGTANGVPRDKCPHCNTPMEAA